MNYSLSVTIDLTEYDEAVAKIVDEGKDGEDFYDFLSNLQEEFAEKVAGYENITFDHSSYIEVNLGDTELSEIETEIEKIRIEIKQIFENKGIFVDGF